MVSFFIYSDFLLAVMGVQVDFLTLTGELGVRLAYEQRSDTVGESTWMIMLLIFQHQLLV